MNKTEEPIVVEATYHASAEQVWNAITNKDEMKLWYFETIENFKPEVGFKTKVDVLFENKHFLHEWNVTKVIENKLVKYDWKYPEFTGNSNVCWELFPLGNSVKLKLSHHGTESFPKDNPDFSRESFTGGWKYFIEESLKDYLGKVK